MSEDKKQDMSERYDTKPTLDTILVELRSFRTSIEERFEALENKLDGVGVKFEAFDVRLDRIESVVNIPRGEMLELRADFRELRSALKEHFPAIR